MMRLWGRGVSRSYTEMNRSIQLASHARLTTSKSLHITFDIPRASAASAVPSHFAYNSSYPKLCTQAEFLGANEILYFHDCH